MTENKRGELKSELFTLENVIGTLRADKIAAGN